MTVKFIKGLSNSIERSTSTNQRSAQSLQSIAQTSGSTTSQAIASKSDAAITSVRSRSAETEKVRDFDKAKALAKGIAEQVLELDKEEAEAIHDPTAVSLKDSFTP